MPAASDLATLLQRALLAQLVEHFHGKEGVIGSSPMEGLQTKGPQARAFPLNRVIGSVGLDHGRRVL